jgi:GNAT superfamily N-acetyltransferase
MDLLPMTGPAEPISTRPATARDLELLACVYQGTRQDEMNSWGWPPAQQESFARMQFNARRAWYAAAYPDSTECVILRDGVSAGSMITHTGSTEIRLVDIALLPEHRNCGIGARLISKLMEDAAALQRPLALRVLRSSPAARLYQRLSFHERPGDDDVYLEMEYHHDQAPR